MPRYLVTGGAGFIGSHLVDQLIERGNEVIILDDLSSGTRDNLNPKAEFILGDINDRTRVKPLLSRVDGCFHLAARLGIVACKEDWLGTHQVNVVGTINLLDLASEIYQETEKLVPMVYASSCAIYGDAKNLPIPEAGAYMPTSSYGADKYTCELQAYVSHHVHHIPAIGLRLFNVYGPRASLGSVDSAVIVTFLDRILNNQPITIFGDGNQTRDFVHVSDVVNTFMYFMNHIQHSPQAFNVCTGESISIHALVQLMEEILGKTVEVDHQAPRPGDVVHSLGDPSKITSLGIKPRMMLKAGLTHLIDTLKDKS
jgi:UDP-glucose 4-epimerase